MSKKIETLEQRNKALEWMVEVANHPLDPINTDQKTRKIYDITSAQVAAFNDKLFEGMEYPPLDEKPLEEDPEQDFSGWLDD